MKKQIAVLSFWAGIGGFCAGCFLASAQTAESLKAESSGTAAFEAATNVPGITVHGKSEAVKGTVRMQRAPDGLLLETIEAWVPVRTLSTGMDLRDEHMRKLVFSKGDGQTPDLRFSGQNVKCPVTPGREVQCKIAGNLSIRGVERPFQIALKVKQEGGASPVFKAAGDGEVKLSEFGIERPSQLGVKTDDTVKLHLALTARSVTLQGGRP